MADYHQPQEASYGYGGQHQISRRMVLCGSLAGLVFGGPLLAMAGLSFLASMTLLVISSPLLLIFSPLLFGAGVVLVAALAGFGTAAAAGLSGLFTFGWISKELGGRRLLQFGLYGSRNTAQRVVEQGKDFAGYQLQENQADERVNRG